MLASAVAQAAALPHALADLASGKMDRVGQAIDELSALADDRALELLEALEAGEVVVEEASGAVYYLKGGDLVSAATGSAAPAEASKGSAPLLNNRLRRKLGEALSKLRLLSPDLDTRRTAALELASGPPADLLPFMKKALDAEQDSEVREALQLASAAIELDSSDSATQLQALAVVEDAGAIRLLDKVSRLAKSENGVAKEVEQEAMSVAASLERKLLVVSGLANLFYGLSLGSVLLLAALGLAITFGLMRVINMAHGEMLMLGAYSTYVVQGWVREVAPSFFDLYLLLALPVAFGVCALVGVLLERTVIRFLYGRPLETLLATWGISLILIQTVRLTFGAQNVAVENPGWLSGGWEFAPTIVLPFSRIAVIVFCAAVVVLVWALLQRTRLGIYVRAVTQNREMAANVGIPTRRIDIWTFALGSGVAGLGGVALSQLGNVGPELGQAYIVDSFMVVVLGGVGSIVGSVAGALGLGVANKFLEPAMGAVLGKILLLVVLILFIQWRPQGMFAPKGRAAEI